MADVIIPEKYTRDYNTDHSGRSTPVPVTTKFSYGTAGFRANATQLPFVVFRVGYLAAIRSKYLNKALGIMVTASHNPVEDNGVKIIDPSGEMLDSSWEEYADSIVNASDEEFVEKMREFRQRYGARGGRNACILTAIDTRPSSGHLEDAACRGAQCANVNVQRLGILTTPQLHYIVRCQNDPLYGAATEKGYYERVRNSMDGLNFSTRSGNAYTPILYLDCANGVGAQQFRKLHFDQSSLHVILVNDQLASLNDHCGADYVKIEKKFPRNFEKIEALQRCASFDGDADRLIYFYRDCSDQLVLVDGDKIAALFAKFLTEQIKGAALGDIFSLSVIQTAYANGNSTKFLQEELGIRACCVATGIKNLQREAMKYDIGVYFEANGHGTVYFSQRFYDIMKSRLPTIVTHKDDMGKKIQVRRLLCFSKLLNTVIGDAMTDLLAVEMLLKYYDWTVERWNNMYNDLPSVQKKIKIDDRTMFEVSANERTCIEPSGLQEKIDNIVANPSGTENVLRIYAEAATDEDVQALAGEVEKAVQEVLAVDGKNAR
ncbi:unnamed protein product [Gongylonema pulchrum]|uniref:Phosphoacetylglucosamine mutase n=1 Tax=Gongylonema pulchrum TaxID=637853 RepID=A0A183DRH2_9BILA|nr:unnamed protein product [Gongylonema pulchrum]